MQDIRDGLPNGSSDKDDARVDAGVDENRDQNLIKLADTHPPPPRTTRWVPRKKAEVVAALRGGFISLDEALQRYGLSIEEYLAWQRGIDHFGLAGLKVKNTQHRRRVRTREKAADARDGR